MSDKHSTVFPNAPFVLREKKRISQPEVDGTLSSISSTNLGGICVSKKNLGCPDGHGSRARDIASLSASPGLNGKASTLKSLDEFFLLDSEKVKRNIPKKKRIHWWVAMVKSIKSNLKQIWGRDGRVHLFGGLADVQNKYCTLKLPSLKQRSHKPWKFEWLEDDFFLFWARIFFELLVSRSVPLQLPKKDRLEYQNCYVLCFMFYEWFLEIQYFSARVSFEGPKVRYAGLVGV